MPGWSQNSVYKRKMIIQSWLFPQRNGRADISCGEKGIHLFLASYQTYVAWVKYHYADKEYVRALII